jgi:hypothetical protein
MGPNIICAAVLHPGPQANRFLVHHGTHLHIPDGEPASQNHEASGPEFRWRPFHLLIILKEMKRWKWCAVSASGTSSRVAAIPDAVPAVGKAARPIERNMREATHRDRSRWTGDTPSKRHQCEIADLVANARVELRFGNRLVGQMAPVDLHITGAASPCCSRRPSK